MMPRTETVTAGFSVENKQIILYSKNIVKIIHTGCLKTLNFRKWLKVFCNREATKKKQEKKFTTVVNYGGGSAKFGV